MQASTCDHDSWFLIFAAKRKVKSSSSSSSFDLICELVFSTHESRIIMIEQTPKNCWRIEIIFILIHISIWNYTLFVCLFSVCLLVCLLAINSLGLSERIDTSMESQRAIALLNGIIVITIEIMTRIMLMCHNHDCKRCCQRCTNKQTNKRPCSLQTRANLFDVFKEYRNYVSENMKNF